jgi:L-ribulose-5-phosphate 3-epimerase
VNIGIRAHDFGKLPFEELASKIADKDFNAIQLALGKALAGINSELGCLSHGMGNYVRDTLAKKGINVAVLGCYINPIHPDENVRRQSLDRFKEHIRYARDFGCPVVGTETGSLNGDLSYNPGNHGEEAFNMLVESVRELVKEAEKFGVFVGIEGVSKNTINTPQRMRRMLDTINSANLQVIFDPVNYLNVDNYKEQEQIIKDSIELFGDRIVILHAKDFTVEGSQLKVVPPGKGMLNYELLISLLKKRKPFLYTLIEDIRPEYMDSSKTYINDLYDKL